MASATIDEQQLLAAIHRIPTERWPEVMRFVESLDDSVPSEPPIGTAGELMQSGMIGLWASRDDISDSQAFARELRRKAETRG